MDIEIYVIKYGNSYVVNNKLNGWNNNDKITKAYLKKAVKVGWITEEEYELIVEAKEKLPQE